LGRRSARSAPAPAPARARAPPAASPPGSRRLAISSASAASTRPHPGGQPPRGVARFSRTDCECCPLRERCAPSGRRRSDQSPRPAARPISASWSARSLRRSGHHPAGRKRPPPAALRAPRRPVAARRGAVSPGGGPAPRARDRRLAGKAIGDVGGGTRTGVALHGLWPPGETMRARRRFLVKLMGLRKGSTLTLTPPRWPSPRLSPAMTELYPRCNGITGMRRRLAACRSDRTCLKRGGVASPAVRSA
jgi:hypothetical protein